MNKNLKVGIITLYYKNYNFGGLLQSYALPYYLNSKGVNCEQIAFDRSKKYINSTKLCKYKKNPLKFLKKILDIICKKSENIISKVILGKKLQRRLDNFKKFESYIPHSNKIYNEENILNVNKIYDIFICGSDVVWSGAISPKIATLEFVEQEKKKFSYAASSTANNLSTEWFELFGNYISKLDKVGVREKNMENFLRVMGIESKTVIDPTLLLNANDWNKIAICPSTEEPYILCYLLGDSIAQRNIIKEFANDKKLLLITIPYIRDNSFRVCDYKFGDLQDTNSGPAEFVGLIKNAEYVITDSFHAIVFSIIYHKEFYVFERLDGKLNHSARLSNILNEFQLQDRLVKYDKINEISKINYDIVNEHLKEIRKKSYDFLNI